ncbi:MAG TPA: uroporphyrinogen-III C-methyltransferase [Thermosynechococcaceae cyanobacterium]
MVERKSVERRGKVFLVGSGTGTLAHLTVQAQQLLKRAEVVLYDALAEGELLSLISSECVAIDVGKRGGKPSMAQAEINRLLVNYCQRGEQVVRLKSGDPFVFGRAQAEIEALRQAKCEFEVIPGLSSALVAPLLAGIPLTDPALSQGFAVVTAHDPDKLNWRSLSELETLVFLMGGRTLPEIVRRLQGHGRSAQTPIAIVRWAGRPQQQIWQGTLLDILDQTTGERLSPCIIIVGEVVQLRPYLQFQVSSPVPTTPTAAPLSGKPLFGKTILITRSASAGQAAQFSDRLQREGATVVELPALEIVPPASWAELDSAIARLRDFDWLILTSANAVDYFFERLFSQLRDVRALAGIKIAVVGDKTANRLRERGLQPDFVPPAFVADSLAEHLPGSLEGAKILFPRVETGGREVLVKDFISRGAEVTEVAAYQSRCPESIAPAALEALQSRRVDAVTFASAKTVKHFCQMLERSQPDSSWQSWMESVCIASIGPETSKACTSLLGRVDAEAQKYTLEGLVTAIVIWFDES